jgi:hypothetical protein
VNNNGGRVNGDRNPFIYGQNGSNFEWLVQIHKTHFRTTENEYCQPSIFMRYFRVPKEQSSTSQILYKVPCACLSIRLSLILLQTSVLLISIHRYLCNFVWTPCYWVTSQLRKFKMSLFSNSSGVLLTGGQTQSHSVWNSLISYEDKSLEIM